MKQTATSDAEVAEIAEGTFNLVNNGDPYRGARFHGMPSTLPRERLGGLIGSYAGTLIALAKGTGQLAAAPVVVEIPGYRVIVERAGEA